MPVISHFPTGSGGSGGGGIPLAPVTDISTVSSAGKVYIKWTDPDDTVLSGATLAEWAGTLLIRKAGSAPVSRRDGTVVIDNKERNAYQNQYFCDTGLSDGVTYYYKFFPYSTTNSYSENEANEFNATPNPVPIGDVSDLNVTSELSERVYLTWTDPAATKVVNGVTVSTWASTKVVYKTGDYPASPDDGTLAINSTTRNAYTSSPLEVTGLTNGTTYYFALFPISTDGAVSTNAVGRITATPHKTPISTVPSQSGTLTYNGNELAPTWSNYNSAQLTIDGAVRGTNAGTYNATFTPTNDYCWSDGSTTAKTISWTINRANISTTPSQNGSLTYNGNSQSPTWSNYNSGQLTIGGTTSGTNAGSYNATFTPKSNYQWSDGSITAKTVSWSIVKLSIAAPTANTTSFTFNGNGQMPTFSYNSTYVTMSGTTAGQVNAGTYTTTFTLKDTDNVQWSGGTTAAKSISWSIDRAAISAVPSQNGTLTYTGNEQTPAWNGYNTAQMTIGGTTKGTSAGSYNATFTPGSNYKWSDGSTGAKTVTWSIAKAAGSLTVSPTSLYLDANNKVKYIYVTRAGNGTITATSSNTGVATVSVSGTTVTVTGVSSGSATITIKVAAGTNHNAPSNKTVSVTAELVPAKADLGSMSWSDIRKVSDAGIASTYWNVGDSKQITVNGTVGLTAINMNVFAFILGFDHNSSREGTNRIHFQIGKVSSSGNQICFCDAQYNNWNGNQGGFTMNPATSSTASTNSGGWNNCHMRKTLLGSANTPTSPTAGTFMNALPSDLRSVMKSCTKYTDNTGGGSNTASYVTATTDYLWLLSEFEVQGARTYANSAEQNYQQQYQYYKNGNTKVFYKHNGTTTPLRWWLRSPAATNAQNFCRVTASGAATNFNSGISLGVAPAFCV